MHQCDAEMTMWGGGGGRATQRPGDRCRSVAFFEHDGYRLCFAHGMAMKHGTTAVRLHSSARRVDQWANAHILRAAE